ncbi:MAG: O-antigen ligase family protein [Roseibium sp.]|nr:O-antigen ligase family protein [Roseibium sp.]
MTQAAATLGPPGSARPAFLVSTASVGNVALWVAVFLSGFVIKEPAPYELYMVVLSVVWMACGLKLRKEFGPLIICMMVYTAGGIAAIPLASEMAEGAIYIAVTGFLAITAIFYAAIVSEDPRRVRIIQNAYLASGTLVALIGIAGYFKLFPGAEFFTLYDRARGTFQDPNVFGPFLVLPAVVLIQGVLRDPITRNGASLLLLPILLLGIFLSFSRGAWGVITISTLIVYVLALICEQNAVRRLRLIGIGALGLFAVFVLIAIALSIDTVADMFQQRARLVQEYDGARLGRFARYALGFEMVLERPLGLGPLEFNKYFPEDEHNVYLKGFTTYGWLGGTVYLLMAGWTFAALVPLLFKSRPWTPFVQCVFAVFAAHLVLSLIIDTDHWRHMYMLYGIAWGMIAVDRMERRALRFWPDSPGANIPLAKAQRTS